MDRITLPLADPTATARLAESIASCLGPGFVLYLSGDLGTGKTTLTRALLRALGYRGRVKSPSFSLLESYDLSSFRLYHFDFYRFETERDWLDAGFDDLVGGAGAAVIEWPEHAGTRLPRADLHVRLSFDVGGDDSARVAELEAGTARGSACLDEVAASTPAASAVAKNPTASNPTASNPTASNPTASNPTASDPTASDPSGATPSASSRTSGDDERC